LLVAKELSYYPTEALEVKEKPRKKTRKIQEKKKKKNNSLAKLTIMSIPMVILGIALSILFRYANITAVRQEITNLERQKVELEKVKLDLVADLEGIKSSVKIAEDAVTKLGMNYPTEGQIVYVSINDNKVEHVEKNSIGKQIRKVFSMVTNLF
jgi:cell division protein FtsL